jgi:hypothetical protein
MLYLFSPFWWKTGLKTGRERRVKQETANASLEAVDGPITLLSCHAASLTDCAAALPAP